MSSVTFQKLQCHNDRPLVDQKTAVEYILNFAGILNLAADTAIFDTGRLSNYGNYDVGVWSDGLGAANGSSGWYPCIHQTAIDGGYSAKFTKTGKGGFMFAGDSSDTYHTIWWSDTNVGVTRIKNLSEILLISIPCLQSGKAEVTVGIQYQSHTAIDTIDDISVGLWFDGMLLLAFAFPYVESSGKLGFAVNDNWEGTFDNLTIYDAHSIVPWTSVDPGESAATGLSRVTAHTALKLLARYDGSVRLHIGGYHSPDWTVDPGRTITLQKRHVVYWQSHVRTVGALHEADTFRPGNQGHIFSTQNDPNALTTSETETKGEHLHKKIEESSRQLTIQLPPNVLLEPGDIVTVDGDNWLIITIEYSIAWQDGVGTVLQSNMQCVGVLES